MTKHIKQLITSSKVHMGPILLDQPLPNAHTEQIDPFLLIHHWADELPGGQHQNQVGVGPHPHRGFAPVTFIFNGELQHRDSRGHDSVVKAGGTQWMFSGKGITHSERPTKELAETGGKFEIIQFWVNVPAKHKMDQPFYQPVSAEDMPVYHSPDGLVKVGVLSGAFEGVEGPVPHPSPLVVTRMDFQEGGKVSFDLPKGFNALMYVLDGKVDVNDDQFAFDKQLVWFEQAGEHIELTASRETRSILLAGAPINEKVTSYGPFVMNDQTEVLQAIRDSQMGKMGVLIEEF